MVNDEPITHVLAPKHSKLSAKEKEELLAHYNISIRELPKIFKADPGIAFLNPKENDIIKIERISPTAGRSTFYRGVIDG